MEPLTKITLWKHQFACRMPVLLLAAVLLCAAVVLACTGGSRDEAVEELTLDRFAECQIEYCDQLIEILETPIEWHLVLDSSRSFSRSPEVDLEKVLTVVRNLPLTEKDSFCFDSFDLILHHRRKCWPDLRKKEIEHLRSVHGGMPRMIEAMQSAKGSQAENRRWTNFIGTLDSLAATHKDDYATCGSKLVRRYYIFLTDGEHDPRIPDDDTENPDRFHPLFTGGRKEMSVFDENTSIDFAGKIVNFVQPRSQDGTCERREQLVLGLRFVIDTSIGEQDVITDWRHGADDLLRREHELAESAKHRVFSPAITLMAIDGNDPTFTESIREEVDRVEGVYACLMSSPSPAEDGEPTAIWPTVHGYPYPEISALSQGCPAWPQEVYDIALPVALQGDPDDSTSLPVQLLIYGGKPVGLTARLQSIFPAEEPDADGRVVDRVSEPFFTMPMRYLPISTAEAGDALFWRQDSIEMPLKFSVDSVNRQRLPVRAHFKFSTVSSSPEFLTMVIRGRFALALTSYLLRTRGVMATALGVISLFISWILLRYAALKPGTLLLRVEGKEKKAAEKPTFLRGNGFRAKIVHESEVKIEEFDPARPYSPPTLTAKAPYFFLDVIPLGFLVYFLVWRPRREKLPKPVGSHVFLDVHADEAVAALVTPHTAWVPRSENESMEKQNDTRSLPERLRSLPERLWGRCWREDFEWGHSLTVENSASTELACDLFLDFERSSLVFRTLAVCFHALAFAAVTVAVLQFLRSPSPVVGTQTLSEISVIALLILFGRFVAHLWPHKKRGKKPGGFLFWMNRWYFVAFAWLLCTASALVFVPGNQAFILKVLLAFFILCVGAAFLFNHWVRKRIEEGKSFLVADIVFDTFLSYGPIAS